MLLCELYAPKQVLQFICPIAISLATDRVADVRTIAFKLVSILCLGRINNIIVVEVNITDWKNHSLLKLKIHLKNSVINLTVIRISWQKHDFLPPVVNFLCAFSLTCDCSF